MDITQKINRGPEEVKMQVREVLELAGEKSTREEDKTVRPEEKFEDAKVIGESSKTTYKIGSGESAHENRLPDKESPEPGFVIIEESERIHTAERENEQEILQEQESEESEDIREAGTNDEVAVEAEIAPSEVIAEDEVLFPDAITPSIMLIIFNIILPTTDILLDTALVQKLMVNDHWGAAVFVTAGILTNFVFTSLAWWRMELAHQKKWSWIFLALQLWPQLRAFQVQGSDQKN